jgi:hypothetical protein
LLPQPFLIELWSNEYENSFALKLSTDQEDSFRAIVTKNHDDGNSNSKFTKIVDMMYYDGSYHYDWSFMLERWIEAWKSGFRHSSSIVPEFLKRHQRAIIAVTKRYCPLNRNVTAIQRQKDLQERMIIIKVGKSLA